MDDSLDCHNLEDIEKIGGRGIRTHEHLAASPVFKTGAINHSAIPPAFVILYPHCHVG